MDREDSAKSRPILTVTLNPAVDQAVALEELILGGTNRCQLDALDPGGKGINASRVMSRLGQATVALGFLAGVTGDMIRAQLDAEGVRHSFGDVPGLTRLNMMVYEKGLGRRTRIYLPGATVSPADLLDLNDRLALAPAGGVVVMGGSLPPGLPVDTYRSLVLWLKDRGVRAVVDTSGPCLQAVLDAAPFLIKPNVEEAADILGRPLRDNREVLQAAVELRSRGAINVVISQGSQGAIGIGPDGAWQALPPTVVARSTVGSGDSMVAGLAIAFNADQGLEEGLRLGTAAGAATAIIPGTQLGRAEDVERFLPQVRVLALSYDFQQSAVCPVSH